MPSGIGVYPITFSQHAPTTCRGGENMEGRNLAVVEVAGRDPLDARRAMGKTRGEELPSARNKWRCGNRVQRAIPQQDGSCEVRREMRLEHAMFQSAARQQ